MPPVEMSNALDLFIPVLITISLSRLTLLMHLAVIPS
jgi:hypothetical protein